MADEHTITVRDGERHVVLFRRVDAESGEDAIHALSRGLAGDKDFGAGNPSEREINWADIAVAMRDGDIVLVPDFTPTGPPLTAYYVEELITALARDLSESIILHPGSSSDEYAELARKLFKNGWRRVPDESDNR